MGRSHEVILEVKLGMKLNMKESLADMTTLWNV